MLPPQFAFCEVIISKTFLYFCTPSSLVSLFHVSVTNLTKLERLHRAASRAITGCLSTSPIPLLLLEASLPPLRVTLTHFTLSSYDQPLRLPTSYPISDLARLEVKPRLCRSSWRVFASTHPIMLPSISSREVILGCPFSPL